MYTHGMAKPLHAVDYLAKPEKHPPRPVCVVFGDEPFLCKQVILKIRSAVLGRQDGECSLSTFDGQKAELRDVLEELDTVAMFGDCKRLVVVEQADRFVTQYRSELEDYVGSPSNAGALVLELKSFPANTRLYKSASASANALVVDCSAPKAAKLIRWLTAWTKQTHHVELPQAAAEMLTEMIGPELGLLDQELAKLALAAGDDKKISAELVEQSVGGWRAKTAWQMLDAALDGNTPEAVLQLDRLLASGEEPIGILAQISFSLRKMAAATRLVLQAEAAGRRVQLSSALEQAGVKPFALQKTGQRLKRLGRQRGSKLYDWLLQADLALKGASALAPRLILERLIVRLSCKG